MSAKSVAQKQLGSVEDYINLKGLNKERTLANDVYNTNTTSFKNAYNDLLSRLAGNRTKAKTDFGKGRAIVNENAYLQNRSDLNDLANRGLNGGLAQLSKVGNRMETGRQFSNLANTYYNTMNELDATERTGTNEFNTQMENAQNTLNATLANIDAREKEGRNAYKAAVAQLAEQIQARWAAQAAANASLKEQQKANKDNAYNALVNQIRSALGDDKSITHVGSVAGDYSKAISKYLGKNVNRSQAMQFMYEAGLYDPSKAFSSNSSKKPSTAKKVGTTLTSLISLPVPTTTKLDLLTRSLFR